jgi:RND family efflux transporter, MFP subunit
LSGQVHNVSLLSGSSINRGGVVVTLEVPEFIDLQQAYLESLSQCEYLEKEYERQKSLSMQEAASQKKFQQSKAEYFSMKSKLDAAKAQLTILDVDVNKLFTDGISPYLEVKSPIGGSVTNLNVNVGKYVSAGDVICEVVNKQAVMLQLTAYEKDLKYLRIGESLKFYVNGLGEGEYVATISSIDKVVDKTNRSIKVFAKVKGNAEQLSAGMYVAAVLLRK